MDMPLEETLNNALNNTPMRENLNHLKNDFTRLRSDLGAIVHDIKMAGQCEAGEAKNKIGAMTQKQLDRLAQAAAQTRAKGQRAVNSVSNQIESHPFASVLAAVGTGFLVGMIARNRATRGT